MIGSYGQIADHLLAGVTISLDSLQAAQFNPDSLRVAISRARKTAAAAGIKIRGKKRLQIQKNEDGSLDLTLEEDTRGLHYTIKED